MKKILLYITLLFVTFSLNAMPPHPDLILEFEERGELPLLNSRIAAERVLGKNIATKSFPTTGTRNVLVILGGFADQSITTTDPVDFYSDLFNGTSSDDLSWKKYYQDMSNGALNLNFTIVHAGNVSGNKTVYGSNTGGIPGNDADPRAFVEEVVANADSLVNFSDFDNDGDGYVDSVMIIHSGAGEESSGSSTDIWSHKWEIDPVTYDSVIIETYGIQPEFVAAAGDSTIGVFVHEFGHVLGLPDLYDTSYSSDGIGSWGIMAGGSWSGPNGKGARPAPLSAWSRMQLGWLTTETIKRSSVTALGTYIPIDKIIRNILLLSFISIILLLYLEKRKKIASKKPAIIPLVLVTSILFATCGEKDSLTNHSISDVEASFEAKLIELSSSEYILIENKLRKDETWTEYLPGSGLLIFHIDDSLVSARFGSNTINDYSLNGTLGIKVIEADNGSDLLDGTDGDSGTYLDLFSQRTRHSLTQYKLNSGDSTNFEINNISEAGSIMTFNLFIDN